MHYPGIAYHPKYPEGKTNGDLSFDNDRLIFQSAFDKFSFDLSAIEMESSGLSNEKIYFRPKDQQDWLILTSDRKILKDAALKKFSHTKEFVRRAKTGKRVLSSLVLLIFGLPLLFVVVLFSFRSPIVKYIAGKVPVHYEKDLGDKMFPLAIEGKKLIQDSFLLEKLQIVTVPLQQAVNDTNFKFTYYVVEDPELNAFALPGGNVVIHSGLIQNCDSYEELAGVLAHELSHVTLRHHVRGLVNNLGMMAMMGMIIGGDDSFYSSVLYEGGELALLKFSRDMETESDVQGFKYLMISKINPAGMVSFFRKLEKKYDTAQSSKGLESAMSFVSTHPATKDRINNLESMLKGTEKNAFEPVGGNFNEFKKVIGKKLSNGIVK